MPSIHLRPRQVGLLYLLFTAVGWGLNWPVMKFLLSEWPPLSARGWAGVTAALAFALLAALRGEGLAIPAGSAGRLLAAAGLNVTAWMGLARCPCSGSMPDKARSSSRRCRSGRCPGRLANLDKMPSDNQLKV